MFMFFKHERLKGGIKMKDIISNIISIEIGKDMLLFIFAVILFLQR